RLFFTCLVIRRDRDPCDGLLCFCSFPVQDGHIQRPTAADHKDPIHFKEDVLRVKRSRFRSVILSGAKDLSLAARRSFAPLRMTQRDGLFFEMYCLYGNKSRSTALAPT